MKLTLTHAFAAIILVLSFAAPVAAGPGEDGVAAYNDGVAAYNRGDYATALRLFRPLADQGVAIAQNNLGVLYEKGQGVSQNYAEAAKWYRLAADQGAAVAQYNLGIMYATGHGLQRNYISAYMWLNLSAAQGNQGAENSRDRVARLMAIAQITEAQKLAREWKPELAGAK
ncbi:MAG TPA: tetratricopeptide repeat protein [Pseudolabrys sp.]